MGVIGIQNNCHVQDIIHVIHEFLIQISQFGVGWWSQVGKSGHDRINNCWGTWELVSPFMFVSTNTGSKRSAITDQLMSDFKNSFGMTLFFSNLCSFHVQIQERLEHFLFLDYFFMCIEFTAVCFKLLQMFFKIFFRRMKSSSSTLTWSNSRIQGQRQVFEQDEQNNSTKKSAFPIVQRNVLVFVLVALVALSGFKISPIIFCVDRSISNNH